MRPPRPLATAVLACCCAVLLVLVAGCGAVTRVPGIAAPHTAASSDASPLVRLHAVRTSAFPENKVAAFAMTSSDAGRITQLYAAIRALMPSAPSVSVHCPVDVEVLYHLTFTRADGTQVTALAKPDGCEWAGISTDGAGSAPHGRIVDWNGFWSLFAATFGIPLRALSWSQASNGPYAPVDVP